VKLQHNKGKKVKAGRYHSLLEKLDTIRIKVFYFFHIIPIEGEVCNTADVAFHP
jgi:hypothetical protein